MALDDIKVIAKNIKAELSRKYPKYGFSVSSERGMTDSLYVAWLSADFNPFIDESTKEIGVNPYYVDRENRLNSKGLNVVKNIYETIKKYHSSRSDGYHTSQNFYIHIKVGKWDKPFEVVGGSNTKSSYPKTTKKSWDSGFLIKECPAGWSFYKKTLPDGRIVYNLKKNPETAPNKNDWSAIRGDMYIELGFKWNPRGQAFEKWGELDNEESSLTMACTILSKYYKTTEQKPEMPKAPEPTPEMPEEKEAPKKEVNESYKSIPDNPYLEFVEVKWAEGLPQYADLFPMRFKSFKQVTKFIADNIEEMDESTYDKHKVEWVFKNDPEKTHSDRWDINKKPENNPNNWVNFWAKEQFQGIFWHVLYYSELTPDDKETKEIDEEYFNLTKVGLELTNEEFKKIVDFVCYYTYYGIDTFPKFKSYQSRVDRVKSMFPKTFSLFEAKEEMSKEKIEKAIRGLRVLESAGNEKAAKAIKGLEILLQKFEDGGYMDNGGQTKSFYIVTFGFEGDDGYKTVKSKPIYASNEDEAAIMLKDQFESLEGMSCDIISVTKQQADGGYMKEGGKNKTYVDLFEDYENQPPKLSKIVDKYAERYMEGDMDYKDTEKFLKEVESVGYTFDYGLDNEPYALRPKGVELSQVEGYEEMKSGGRTKSGLMRDRKYKSNEPHEKAYKRKRKPKNRKYSKQ
jgi:hypothetical protein